MITSTRDYELPTNRDTGTNNGTIESGGEGLIGLYPYSGADIKLVVHLPSEDPAASQDTNLTELQTRLDEINHQLESIPSQDTVSEASRQAAQLRLDLETAVTIVQGYTAVGTTEQIAEANEEVNRIQTELDEQVSLIREGSVDGSSLESLQSERAELTRAIESANEEQSNGESGTTPQTETSITKTLAEVQTLSYSIHREKFPVRTLGSIYPRSYTRGPVTISGSMVFTVFHQHIFHEFFTIMRNRSTGVGDWDRHVWSSYITHQLPPMDISISFANEYGNVSWMCLLGVEFVNEGQVMSIEDLFTEGTAQYVARDIDLMLKIGEHPVRRNLGVQSNFQDTSGDTLLWEHFRRRVANRQNPFY
jgi:flagellar motor protein MotB